jgi:hypothetical protein
VIAQPRIDRAGQRDAQPAADAERGGDEADRPGDPLLGQLVPDDREGEREQRAAQTLRDPARQQDRQQDVATPATIVPAASAAMVMTRIRRLPNMSPSRPRMGVATEADSRYPVSTQVTACSLTCRLRPISGSTGITRDCRTLNAIAARPSTARVRPGFPRLPGRTVAALTSSTVLQARSGGRSLGREY